MYDNQFSGPLQVASASDIGIYTMFYNLSTIRQVLIQDNCLTGQISSEIGKFADLTDFSGMLFNGSQHVDSE
jgi:hypothetical protein